MQACFYFTDRSDISTFPPIDVTMQDTNFQDFTLSISSEHYLQYFPKLSSSGKYCYLLRIEPSGSINILGTPNLNASANTPPSCPPRS